MTLEQYPLRDHGAIPRSFSKKPQHRVWLWQVEMGAFDCPLEPLTQEFWRENLHASLIYGILLPTLDARANVDTLLLISEKIGKPGAAKSFGNITAAQRYEIYKFIQDQKLPNTEHLSRMHHFARIAYLKTYEETFQKYILPTKDTQGKYQRACFVSAKPLILNTVNHVRCPNCKQPRHLEDGLILLGMQLEDTGSVRLFCVCEMCDQPFIFSTYAQHLESL